MDTVKDWAYKARLFALKQRAEELKKAMKRFATSDRKRELDDIEEELKDCGEK